MFILQSLYQIAHVLFTLHKTQSAPSQRPQLHIRETKRARATVIFLTAVSLPLLNAFLCGRPLCAPRVRCINFLSHCCSLRSISSRQRRVASALSNKTAFCRSHSYLALISTLQNQFKKHRQSKSKYFEEFTNQLKHGDLYSF